MILATGLTPAWQQIAVLDELRQGEVSRAREVHWCASGKVLNVGLALTQLGATSRTLSLVGSGPAGDAVRADFSQFGVAVRWVESLAPQRVCTTLLDRSTGQTTEIVENSAAATSQELQRFENEFADEASRSNLVILTGSLPTGTPREFYSTLLSHLGHSPLDRTNIADKPHVLLDIRGPELLAALPHRPLVVKPNREELAHTVGRSLVTDDDVWQAMQELNQLGAVWVVVTNGPRNVLVSHANGNRWTLIPPSVPVVNPIGCGDCFTAGLAFALHQDQEPLSAIRFGIAAAALNATDLLPARLNLQAVTSLVGQVVTASTA